ncbi:hypothetical protein ALC62_09412, partial [Cyphomyrmex costatus]
GGEEDKKEGEKARQEAARGRGGWREEKEEETQQEQEARRSSTTAISRELIPLPPSHLIALSHATSGCVGVSGRLKKHGRLRPSI